MTDTSDVVENLYVGTIPQMFFCCIKFTLLSHLTHLSFSQIYVVFLTHFSYYIHQKKMAEGGMNLEQQFVNFSKFGDTKSDGRTITLTQIDKWLKQAQVIGKKITTTDTGICFNKFKYKNYANS